MAGDGQVKIEMTSEYQALLAAWERQSREVDKLSAKLSKLEQTSKKGKDEAVSFGDAATASFMRAAAGVASFATAAMAARAVAQTLNDELERRQRLQMTAGQFQTAMASAASQAVINLGDDPNFTSKMLTQTVNRIARETGTPRQSIWDAANSVLSASTSVTKQESLHQLGLIAALDPDMPSSSMAAMAGTSLDLRKEFGGTAKEMAGVMKMAAETNRTVSIEMFGQNVAGKISGLGKYGASLKEAIALTSALSQESADVEGRISSTGSLNLAKQWQEATAGINELEGASPHDRLMWLAFARTEEAKARRGGLRAKITGETELAAMTPGGTLNAEAKIYPAALELLDPNSKTFKTYMDILSKVPSLDKGDEVYDRVLQQQLDVDVIRVSRERAKQLAQKEEILGLPMTGEAGAVAEQLQAQLEQMGRYGVPSGQPLGGILGLGSITPKSWGLGPWVEKEMADFQTYLSEGMEPSEAADELRRRRREIHRKRFDDKVIRGVRIPSGFVETSEEAEISRLLDEQLPKRSGWWGDMMQNVRAAQQQRMGGGEGSDEMTGGRNRTSRIERLLEQVVANTADKNVRVVDDERSAASRRRTPQQAPMRRMSK